MKSKYKIVISLWIAVFCFFGPSTLVISFNKEEEEVSRRVKSLSSPVSRLVSQWQNIERDKSLSSYQKSDQKFDKLRAFLSDFVNHKIDVQTIQQELIALSKQQGVPEDIRKFLAFLINSPPENVQSLTTYINDIAKARNRSNTGLSSLEQEMLKAQGEPFSVYVNDVQRRETRMNNAYKVSTELDSSKSKLVALLKGGVPFLENYTNELWIRAQAVNYENVLYTIVKNNIKAGVIPFIALKSLRGPNFTWGFDKVTMRQYIGFHLGRSNIYGLAITEAENKPQTIQGDHNHPGFEEETVFLSDNVVITSGDKDKSTRAFTPDPKTKQIYNFGDMSFAPLDEEGKGIQHRLENPNKYPSVDFTLKGPLAQIIKGPSGPKGKMGITYPRRQNYNWGEIYTQIYRKNNGQIPTSIELDGDYIIFDANGNMKEENFMPIETEVVVVKNGKETPDMSFSSLDEKVQVIHIFPWPKNILDETEKWLSEENLKKIKAEVTLIDEHGNTATATVYGGDVIALNNGGENLEGFNKNLSGKIVSYRIRNISDDGLELMFMTLNKSQERYVCDLSSMGNFQWSTKYEKGKPEDGTYKKGEFRVERAGDSIEAEFKMSFMEDRDPWAPRPEWEKIETFATFRIANDATELEFKRADTYSIKLVMPGKHLLGFAYTQENLYFIVSDELYQEILTQIKDSVFYYPTNLPVSQFLTVEEARERGLWD
ncbi:MAG: hypothetical protein NC828_03625 [Candidatus Omnitrophica bacterium]|nr:hypothetical protein [Candidatus Omnitrophota bacterium]